jgi:hypothetical protein
MDTPFLSVLMIVIATLLAFLLPRRWLAHTPRRQPEVILAAVPLDVAMQTQLIRELTHLHTPELDALMVKLGPPLTLTDAELESLHAALLVRAQDQGSQMTQEEREAAELLPLVLKRARRVRQTLDLEAAQVQLVLLPSTQGDPS